MLMAVPSPKDMLGSEKAKTRKEEVEPEKRKKSKRKGQQTEVGHRKITACTLSCYREYDNPLKILEVRR